MAAAWDITEAMIAEAVAGALSHVGGEFEDVADIDVQSVTTNHRGNVVSVTVEYDDEGSPGFIEFAMEVSYL